jgi:hypothetical protein
VNTTDGADRATCLCVEAIDRCAVGGLESKVEARGGWAVVADEEFVRGEPTVALACDPESEGRESGGVEALARTDVPHAQVHVVEEPAGMRLTHRAPA